MTQTAPGTPRKAPESQPSPRAFLERALLSADGDGDAMPAGGERPPDGLGGRRVEGVIRQIECLLRDELLPLHFSVLHIGCGDGRLLAELRRHFPQADCYGVDWPGRLTQESAPSETSGVQLYEGDLDRIFQSVRKYKKERFDLVLMSGGFDAPAGPNSTTAPPWADGWLGKNVKYVIAEATPERLRALKERGQVVPLEPGGDRQLVCWTETYPLPATPRGWSRSSPWSSSPSPHR